MDGEEEEEEEEEQTIGQIFLLLLGHVFRPPWQLLGWAGPGCVLIMATLGRGRGRRYPGRISSVDRLCLSSCGTTGGRCRRHSTGLLQLSTEPEFVLQLLRARQLRS
jgi:hypothetical protein